MALPFNVLDNNFQGPQSSPPGSAPAQSRCGILDLNRGVAEILFGKVPGMAVIHRGLLNKYNTHDLHLVLLGLIDTFRVSQ